MGCIEQRLENTDAVKDNERNHLTEDDLAAGYRMACQTFVNGDVSGSWIPLELRKPVRSVLPGTGSLVPGAGAGVSDAGSGVPGT